MNFAEAFQKNFDVQVYVGNEDDDFHGNVEVRTIDDKVFVYSGWGGVSQPSIAEYPALSTGAEYKRVHAGTVSQACDIIKCLLRQETEPCLLSQSVVPRKKARKIGQ